MDKSMLSGFLRTGKPPAGASEKTLVEWSWLGAVHLLENDPLEENLALLQEAAQSSHQIIIRSAALQALIRLAEKGVPTAIQSLYTLALQEGIEDALQAIKENRLPAPSNPEAAGVSFLLQDWETFKRLDPDRILLTSLLLESGKSTLRERAFQIAANNNWRNWMNLLQAFLAPSPTSFENALFILSSLDPHEHHLWQFLIKQAPVAQAEPGFGDLLCAAFIRYQDPHALKAALRFNLAPGDPVQKALFYFLSEQWDAYQKTDFQRRLLAEAFESASPELRRRIIAVSRKSGMSDWIEHSTQGNRLRSAGQLSDEDWKTIITALIRDLRFSDLWRLVMTMPPIRSMDALLQLSTAGWVPVSRQEEEDFQRLLELARSCANRPLQIERLSALTQEPGVQKTAFLSGQSLLVVGRSDSSYQVLAAPNWQASGSIFHGPLPNTEALAISPDGSKVIVVNSDHALRVYDLSSQKWIKSLPGHTAVVRAVLIHPNGKEIISGGFDRTIRVWRYPAGPELSCLQNPTEIFSLALDPARNLLYCAGASNGIQAWNLYEQKEAALLDTGGLWIKHLAIDHQNNMLAGCSRENTLLAWNLGSQRLIRQKPSSLENITALQFVSSGQILLAAGDSAVDAWTIGSNARQTLIDHLPGTIAGMHLTSPNESDLTLFYDGGMIETYSLKDWLRIRIPLVDFSFRSMQELQIEYTSSSRHHAAGVWRNFLAELLRCKHRFDIELEPGSILALSDFDIQL